jgi:hypothetical protein
MSGIRCRVSRAASRMNLSQPEHCDGAYRASPFNNVSTVDSLDQWEYD